MPVSAAADDWLFAFQEVSKVYFQKRMGMQKGDIKSFCGAEKIIIYIRIKATININNRLIYLLLDKNL
jgi:hypothetical protein